jgi:hypothetical protein
VWPTASGESGVATGANRRDQQRTAGGRGPAWHLGKTETLLRPHPAATAHRKRRTTVTTTTSLYDLIRAGAVRRVRGSIDGHPLGIFHPIRDHAGAGGWQGTDPANRPSPRPTAGGFFVDGRRGTRQDGGEFRKGLPRRKWPELRRGYITLLAGEQLPRIC